MAEGDVEAGEDAGAAARGARHGVLEEALHGQVHGENVAVAQLHLGHGGCVADAKARARAQAQRHDHAPRCVSLDLVRVLPDVLHAFVSVHKGVRQWVSRETL